MTNLRLTAHLGQIVALWKKPLKHYYLFNIYSIQTHILGIDQHLHTFKLKTLEYFHLLELTVEHFLHITATDIESIIYYYI